MTNYERDPSEVLEDLSQDVKYLGNLLGHIIKEQHGESAFQLVERVRALTKARRKGDTSAPDELQELISGLDLESHHVLIKAFSNYFQLINIAEDQQRIRVLRERERDQNLNESMYQAIKTLKENGLNAQDIRALLNKLSIRLVLTAHPSEAKRREVLVKLEDIAHLMSTRDLRDQLPREARLLEIHILEKIEELWQTAITRHARATVDDEVDFGMHFITTSIMRVTYAIYESLRLTLREFYPEDDWSNLPPFLRFASWIGGDRDGNPFVTPEVTFRTLDKLRAMAQAVYRDEVIKLRDSLTQSRDHIDVSAALVESLDGFQTDIPYAAHEIYRQKMLQIQDRLENNFYASSEQLLDDLKIVQRSLRTNQGRFASGGRIQRLISWVELFGFQLTPLDVREDARFHSHTVSELFAYYGITDDYEALSEEEKQALLTKELDNNRPLFPDHIHMFSDTTQRVINIWRMIDQIHQQYGKFAVDTYIASHSEQVSDVLTMLLFAKEVGVDGNIDITPLFETVDSLIEAPEVMESLYQHPQYATYLGRRANRQQIMLGYSDSCKDGGYMASNWSLYIAQANLSKVCKKYDVSLELFHGRGGSIGRGGGPTNRAILSQPPESIHGRIKITEQGEVIAYRYSNQEIANRHLQQVMHAMLLMVGHPPKDTVKDEWRAAMEMLSAEGRSAWRDFVYETTGFGDYWMQATPINELSQMPIGSRPAKRSKGGFENVRAIPWVFSWMQSRAIIPSWFGIGHAFDKYCEENENGLEVLQEMYQNWSFFKALIQNTQLDLAKADMGIVQLYADLVVDEDLRVSITERILSEHERASKYVCDIVQQSELLEKSPTLKLSIERRNPYVDPLNFIQIVLLKKLRVMSSDDRHYQQHLDVVLSTINGIAAAMKTTG